MDFDPVANEYQDIEGSFDPLLFGGGTSSNAIPSSIEPGDCSVYLFVGQKFSSCDRAKVLISHTWRSWVFLSAKEARKWLIVY